ncbi:MAG: hypothetical protein K1060chlam1_00810 [Candidatus Anoxychlamydiales bacterium]|nr:hypothetical protein [Candidatus Anoxychlamydiales bacterium]
MSSISYDKIRKIIKNESFIFYEFQNIGSGKELLALTTHFMDEPSIIAMAKTCRFFYHYLKTRRELIEKYFDLLQMKIFNLQEISSLPTMVLPSKKTIESLRPEELTFPLTIIEYIGNDRSSSQSLSLYGRVFIAFKYNVNSGEADSIVCKTIEIIGKNYHIIINDKNEIKMFPYLLEPWEVKRFGKLMKMETVGENIIISSSLCPFSLHEERNKNRCKLIDREETKT